MKRRVVFAALLLAILVALAWSVLSPHEPPEPVYEGKLLNLWIEQYGRNVNITPRNEVMDAEEAQARKAIHAIGTNAFPSLLTWAGDHDSFLKLRLRKLISGTRSQYLTGLKLKVRPDLYHHRAVNAFEVFGPDGAPATPGLVHLLGDRDDEVRVTAMHCLERIGPSAIAAVPALVGCLKETNDLVRYFAIRAVGCIHGEPEVAVPVLIEILNEPKGKAADYTLGVPGSTEMSAAAIWALGTFATDAKSAVPALVKALNDDDSSVRDGAGKALKAIDPEAAARAGVK